MSPIAVAIVFLINMMIFPFLLFLSWRDSRYPGGSAKEAVLASLFAAIVFASFLTGIALVASE